MLKNNNSTHNEHISTMKWLGYHFLILLVIIVVIEFLGIILFRKVLNLNYIVPWILAIYIAHFAIFRYDHPTRHNRERHKRLNKAFICVSAFITALQYYVLIYGESMSPILNMILTIISFLILVISFM